MSTVVKVYSNGSILEYYFKDEADQFLVDFQDEISAKGYYVGFTAGGKLVTINPSQCGIVEITEG